MTEAADIRRLVPKMDKVLAWPELASTVEKTGHTTLREAVRKVLDQLRHSLSAGNSTDLSPSKISELIKCQLKNDLAPSLVRVINGSGVIIHTNLGRSPLPAAAEAAMRETAFGYSNLEYDLKRGERGERYVHVEQLLCELTGSEAAIAVNNNASAVMLALSALAKGREVIVSRGELVEIGGSFRIPEVMSQSGAALVEVGTTNRTHPKDYSNAINEQTALLLKVHTSNFAVVGFTAEVSVNEMSAIGINAGIPVMVDAGSGCLVDLSKYGISGEKTIQEQLKSGADIVTFSGDKLLGGPQAGLIAGKKAIIEQIKKHPLLRAVRIDKLTLAALEATLRLYRDERQALAEIPVLRMLTISAPELRIKGLRFLKQLRRKLPAEIVLNLEEGNSSPGGGTFPLMQLPTTLISFTVPEFTSHRLEEALRSTSPAVVGRLYKDSFLLDVRTISDDEIPLIVSALKQLIERL